MTKFPTSNFSCLGESRELVFSSTASWEIEISDEGKGWVEVSPSSGEAGTNLTITVTVARNDDPARRTAELRLKAGSSTITRRVSQNGFTALEVEKQALIAFYQATNGDQWSENSRRNRCTDESLDKWSGVTLNEEKTHVVGLSFTDAGLTGTLPPEMAELTELEKFTVFTNSTSTLPNFSAVPFPDVIGKMKSLKHLYISDALFTGTIPDSWFSLENLEYMVLWRFPNSAPTTLPSSIGKMKKLTHLSLHNINLSGPLPSSMRSMPFYWRIAPGFFPQELHPWDRAAVQAAQIPCPESQNLPACSGNTVNLQSFFATYDYSIIFSYDPTDSNSLAVVDRMVSLVKRLGSGSKRLGVLGLCISYAGKEQEWNSYLATAKDVIREHSIPWETVANWIYAFPHTQKGGPFYCDYGDICFLFNKMLDIHVYGPDHTMVFSSHVENIDNVFNFLEEQLNYN